MRNPLITFTVILLTTFFITSCRHYENGNFEDLSNDVVNDNPQKIKEEDKKKLESTINDTQENIEIQVYEEKENEEENVSIEDEDII